VAKVGKKAGKNTKHGDDQSVLTKKRSLQKGETFVPGPPLRPKDAATLILIRRDGKQPRVLMGKRAGGHAFMPNLYVFPGGRVDAGDGRVPSADELSEPHLDKLLQAPINAARARALAMAAVRETYEETGVIIGSPGGDKPVKTKSKHWQPFYDTGFLPELSPLRFVFRAITPPNRSRRFDTRFFMLFADETKADVPERLTGSGELEGLDWIPLSDMGDIEIPTITETVLKHVRGRVKDKDPAPPVPFVHFSRGVPKFEQH